MAITLSGDSPNLTSTSLTTPTLTSPTITGAVVSTMASSVITAGTAVASTSGTAITFTSIPSWVKRITVMLAGVSSSGTSKWQLQIGNGSIVTTGYVSNANAMGTNVNATSGSSLVTTGFVVLGYSATAASTYNGQIVLTLLGNNVWVSSGAIGSSLQEMTSSAGTLTLSSALDRVSLTTINGTDTFDAGSINILYE
jgi:hypothetical protein